MTIHIIESGETREFKVTTSEFLNVFDNELELIIVIGDKYNYRANAGSSITPPKPFTTFEVRNPHSQDLLFSFKNGMGSQSELAQVGDVVAVSSIVHPVTIGNFPAEQSVTVTNLKEMTVNIPDVSVTMPDELTIGNFPDVQQVEITNHPESEPLTLRYLGNYSISAMNATPIATAGTRKGYLFHAPKTNSGAVTIGNIIELEPGGHANVPASNRLSISGNGSDRIKIAEWV